LYRGVPARERGEKRAWQPVEESKN